MIETIILVAMICAILCAMVGVSILLLYHLDIVSMEFTDKSFPICMGITMICLFIGIISIIIGMLLEV